MAMRVVKADWLCGGGMARLPRFIDLTGSRGMPPLLPSSYTPPVSVEHVRVCMDICIFVNDVKTRDRAKACV